MSRARPGIVFGSTTGTDGASLARQAGDAVADGADVVEVRADAWADPAPEPIRSAIPDGVPACYTLRSRAHGGAFAGSAPRAIELRERAAAAGFDWVDVEAPPDGPLPPLPAGVRTILSLHDLAGVPADGAACYDRLRGAGADVVKIVGTAVEPADAAPLLALLPGHGDLAAWCMGEAGLASRLLAWRRGCAALFGAADPDRPAAPGQPSVRDLVQRYRIAELGPGTAIYALLGDPVAHSRGPALHNRIFADLGVDAVYLPVRCQDLPAAVEFLRSAGGAGCSVTIPHKEAAATLPELSADALVRHSGSANTLRLAPDGGAMTATSTDGAGLLRAIAEGLGRDAGPDDRALVLGAGGAAAAAAQALAAAGVAVAVTGRTAARADALARRLGVESIDWEARHEVGTELLVNATPLGMRPEDPLPAQPDRIADLRLVCDAVYTPPVTPLLTAAADAGLAVASGVRMFLHQAHAQLEFWDIGASLADVERAWAAVEG